MKSSNTWRRIVGAIAGSLAFIATAGAAETVLLNVSYDPTRELYEEYNKAFAAYQSRRADQDVHRVAEQPALHPDADLLADLAGGAIAAEQVVRADGERLARVQVGDGRRDALAVLPERDEAVLEQQHGPGFGAGGVGQDGLQPQLRAALLLLGRLGRLIVRGCHASGREST